MGKERIADVIFGRKGEVKSDRTQAKKKVNQKGILAIMDRRRGIGTAGKMNLGRNPLSVPLLYQPLKRKGVRRNKN